VAFLTVAVRAKPGASRTGVGGSYGEPPQLIVRVNAPAVDGRANEAVRAAVAEAFGITQSNVELAIGESARSKVLRIHGDITRLAARLQELLVVGAVTLQPDQPDLFEL
jgi:hypothetical protein